MKSGTISCLDDEGRELARVGKGSCFGELALLNSDNKRAAHVYALEDVETFRLSREVFTENLGDLA